MLPHQRGREKLLGVAAFATAISLALGLYALWAWPAFVMGIPFLLAPFTFAHFHFERNYGGRSFITVANTAAGLGFTLAEGIFLLGSRFNEFGVYLIVIFFYHWGEFALTAWFNTDTAGVDAFVVNHSQAWAVAQFVCVLEYWVEKLFLFPEVKGHPLLFGLGLAGVIFGEFWRKGGMWTAAHNFTHLISYKKKERHQLVTWGLYRFVRHPGYFGWFYWVIFCQVLLGNPVSAVAFAYVAWKFFVDRIPDEEEMLCRFFPGEYEQYRSRTPTLIPFVP